MAAPKKSTAKATKAPTKKAVQSATARSRAGVPRGDLTGRRKQEGLEALTAEQEAERERLTTATSAQKEVDDSTIDDFTGEGVSEEELAEHGISNVEEIDPSAPLYDDGDDDDLEDLTEQQPVEANVVEPDVVVEDDPDYLPPASEIVMPREDCRFIMGAGTLYTFTAGRRAKVPFAVAQHMREKGLTW
jgi:hypothetical protein